MSLIPSESYSFPDHFSTTVVPSRKPKNERAETEVQPARAKRPAIVALPDPEPIAVRQNGPPPVPKTPPSPPNPALLRANAPPARVPQPPARSISVPPPSKPKAISQKRAPGIDPVPLSQNRQNPPDHAKPVPAAQNVIPMQPVQAPAMVSLQPPDAALEYTLPAADPVPPRMPVRPQPARPAPRTFPVQNLQPEFFEILAQNVDGTIAKRRRKMKFHRFLACESAALAVLLPLAIFSLLNHTDNVALRWTMNILTIGSAIVAALIPILFYAITPTLPEIER
jgi:hypothetical protein